MKAADVISMGKRFGRSSGRGWTSTRNHPRPKGDGHPKARGCEARATLSQATTEGFYAEGVVA